MTVSELIAHLQNLPQDAVVNITTEHEFCGESCLSYDEIGEDDIVLSDTDAEVYLG